MKTKLYYARARNMLVIPTFVALPDSGPVRLILSKVCVAAACNGILK